MQGRGLGRGQAAARSKENLTDELEELVNRKLTLSYTELSHAVTSRMEFTEVSHYM